MSMPRSVVSGPPEQAALAKEIAEMLTRTPRQLPSHALYDPLGSSLFEAICHLPWYRISRVERRLLASHSAVINGVVGPISAAAELGPGSGEKLATLLSARRRHNIRVFLIDVSAEALEQATRTLSAVNGLDISALQTTYEEGLSDLDLSASPAGALVAFLGSNIGNFDREVADALLRAIRGTLRRGGFVLLGTDLVKPEAELRQAYDDPLGVTAAFNRNILVRINRELGGNFDLGSFVHRATWNAHDSRMEMHLVSTRRQRVRVRACDLDITFEDGEPIWTESSYKYRVEELAPMLARAGFRMAGQWVDGGFALTLAETSAGD
jgi:L-histidine Nalpha-methyltransferase